MIIVYEPVIKWSGSKRSQAEQILQRFPKEIATYYEPFCGGASVLRRLLSSDITVKEYVCSDLNDGLIALWKLIKEKPTEVGEYYRKLWSELNKDADKERKKAYFAEIREHYNREHNPLDFMFIMRTTTNGMPRYNKDGEFNNSFHVTRDGIHPDTLDKILEEWGTLLKVKDVQFRTCSYSEIQPSEKDYMYLDPPYAATKGMYYGKIDYAAFWDWLRKQNCGYCLSFDGKSGDTDNTYAVPVDIYDTHEYLCSGNSSFKRTIGKSNDSIVYESLYVRSVQS